jgi:hypothetical protein
VKVLNTSKSTATLEMSLSQVGILRCKFLGTFGTLDRIKGLTKWSDSCPELPPVEECIDASKMLRHALGDALRIANTFDLRLPKDDEFMITTMSGKTGNFWFLFFTYAAD